MSSLKTSDDVIKFWLDEIGPKNWYFAGAEIDQKVRDFALSSYKTIRAEGRKSAWLNSAKGTLAYIIMFDQFPRNMFRDTGQAFASDGCALEATMRALNNGWDMAILEPERSFFYLPLMHSENLVDQNLCIEKFKKNMPKTGENSLIHAYAHREVIKRFGRFPLRNKALKRASTPQETDFIKRNLYEAFINAFKKNEDVSTVI